MVTEMSLFAVFAILLFSLVYPSVSLKHFLVRTRSCNGRLSLLPAQKSPHLLNRLSVFMYNCRRDRKLAFRLYGFEGEEILSSIGVRKTIIRSGSGTKYPQPNSTVEIRWKMYRSDGSLAHDSVALEEPFQFRVVARPSEVIQGWDAAVQTMTEGEISRFEIPATAAFGAEGLEEPTNIAPNEDISCELHLVRIVPRLTERYKTIGANESIREELMKKMQSESSEFSVPMAAPSSAVSTDKAGVDTQSGSAIADSTGATVNKKGVKEVKFFDPSQHKLDPNQRVGGEGDGHLWEETMDVLDVKIPLPDDTSKSALIVDIKSSQLAVVMTDSSGVRSTLLSGPLHGKILPSESSWAIVRSPLRPPYADQTSIAVDFSSPSIGRGGSVGNCYLQLSLIKAHGSQDIWATVLDREFLRETKGVDSAVDDDDIDNYEKHFQ